MRLLVLGGTGQVGTEFRTLAQSGGIEIVAPGRAALDLEDPAGIAPVIAAGPWSAVINAAAYTDVDRAESEEAKAFAINAQAPSRLAAETAQSKIPLIHISTDYVFDGRKGAPYVEGDSVAPLNAYGRSKLAGERAVRTGNPRHIVLRTSWVYSPFGRNFLKTIVRLTAERDQLRIVSDQRGSPTAACDIAKACMDVARHCTASPENVPYGVYHFAGAGEASWFEFAIEIVRLAKDRLGRSPQILPIGTADYPTPATRPFDTRLNCAAISRAFGIAPRLWRDALAETVNRLLTHKDNP